MLAYSIRRVLLMIPTLIGVTAVVFFIMAWSPGGIGGSEAVAGGEMEGRSQLAQQQYLNERYGLDAPLVVQYGRWLNRVSPVGFASGSGGKVQWDQPRLLKWPDLGESLAKRRPVIDLYAEALPVTLLLNVLTSPVTFVLSVWAGIVMARRRGGAADVGLGSAFLGLWSLPQIWVGVLLLGYLASSEYLKWFPTGGLSSTRADEWAFLPSFGEGGAWNRGWLMDRAWHLVLPVLCLAYADFAFLSKLMRSSVLENYTADFVRTARAKGLREKVVLYQHVLRNSLLPLITVSAGVIPALIGGSVIIESIFSIPGMGKLTIDGIFARDRELVLAGALVSGVLGLFFILVADLAYAVADPRVSYD
ncbi:MAG: ABC transporter permease [Planctomycetota bacterium]